MRLLLFPLLLASLNSYAQLDTGNGGPDPCTEADVPAAGGTLECTSLLLSGGAIAQNNDANPLVIKVTGNVQITGLVTIKGQAGTTLSVNTFSQVFGGQGSFGAGDGGGEDGFGVLFQGMLTDSSAIDPFAGSGQEATASSLVCGDGGGGAAMRTLASASPAGTACGGSGSPGVAASAVTADTIFNGTFRGGAGGGAGGDGPTSPFEFGAGGGGGGALHIIAGGDINITSTIDARGGNGGDGGIDGGGGGAGSGGVIWLQSLRNINISGSLNVLGGTGGTATAGGVGGNGGDGFIRLDDADGVITGGGSFPNAITNALSATASSSTLKSDISCGTVKPSEERDNMLLQLILAFLAVEIFARLVRKYSFKRYRIPFGKSKA